MFTLEPLRFRGHSYDPRPLAAPLETLVLRAALARAAKPSNEAALALVLLTDSEGVLEDQRRRVHSTASSAGPLRRVCSCGLVMGDLDPVAATGHLDTVTWQPTDVVVLATRHADGRERFAMLCQACGWASPASSGDDAHAAAAAHDCAGETRDAPTNATLRAHLHP